MEIKKILIANRGEVALRIIRTCREMGIKTVALCPFKGQEHNFLETKLADEYYFLEKEGAVGYLDGKLIVEIAKKAGADAIHPGYGFLAENWEFAKLCKKKKIKFIGPDFKILKKFEDKIEAKKTARKLDIPTLPFSDKSIKKKKDLIKWINIIKPPFILKALKGGGGIGIRLIDGQVEFESLPSLCMGIRRQILGAFSGGEFFIEKYLKNPRHIEFQILGDGKNFLHLGERECTIQRRHQKLLEEAPSAFLNDKDREKLSRLAIKLVKEVKYKGVGTVEFLIDKDKNFYFLEVNPRLQVEHPVTEAITGVDIVEQQIRIAQGEPISFSQDDVDFKGWAMEARINAEDPAQNFLPKTGIIEKYFPPGGQGIFIHTFCHTGQEIYPYFDSLLAKLISLGETRDEAISKLKRALDEFIIEGVPTTIPFFKILLENKDFLSGNFFTNFIEKNGILRQIKCQVIEKIPVEATVLNEKDVAELVFEIYQNLKNQGLFKGKEATSNWQMIERLKMLE